MPRVASLQELQCFLQNQPAGSEFLMTQAGTISHAQEHRKSSGLRTKPNFIVVQSGPQAGKQAAETLLVLACEQLSGNLLSQGLNLCAHMVVTRL